MAGRAHARARTAEEPARRQRRRRALLAQRWGAAHTGLQRLAAARSVLHGLAAARHPRPERAEVAIEVAAAALYSACEQILAEHERAARPANKSTTPGGGGA